MIDGGKPEPALDRDIQYRDFKLNEAAHLLGFNPLTKIQNVFVDVGNNRFRVYYIQIDTLEE